jgi:single-strand DNA-binding protein
MPVSISIVGNVGNEPEVRKTNSGLEIVEIRVASQDGKDKTSWWTCKFFGNKAGETVSKHVKKGSSVMVIGTAEEETWGEGDKKKSKIVVNASSFSFVGGAKSGGEKSADKPKSAQKQEDDNGQDSVPF